MKLFQCIICKLHYDNERMAEKAMDGALPTIAATLL